MAGRRTVLETDRLALTTWVAADWMSFREITGDPLVTRYIGRGQTWDAARTRAFVDRQIANQATLGYCLWQLRPRPGGMLGGFVGLQPYPELKGVEIGWWLRPTLWGRGLASTAARAVLAHAFRELEIDPVYAIVQPANTASRRVTEAIGMVLDHPRQHRGVEVVIYRGDRP